jgi:hypothetical protein
VHQHSADGHEELHGGSGVNAGQCVKQSLANPEELAILHGLNIRTPRAVINHCKLTEKLAWPHCGKGDVLAAPMVDHTHRSDGDDVHRITNVVLPHDQIAGFHVDSIRKYQKFPDLMVQKVAKQVGDPEAA